MGSRINIKLCDLMHNPKITVRLYTEQLSDREQDEFVIGDSQEQRAEVSFDGHVAHFDAESHMKEVTLSRDFNFFRDTVRHGEFMKQLYEHSVSFTVHH